ncbi:MAG: sodium-extruding oxaloacetate decarboxylase subunit alpha [Legionellaceae bacterium]|nr:sodium-extruding oxaloacetate decarboxylase subunit alpha [Legionellaceae bacterium]
MPQTFITDVTLRDAHQCLIATRLRTEDMLPVCPQMNAVGFWAMEVWGGATFDACLRFLKEDPWQRLRQLRSALPDTRLSMLLRGQNLLGYRHYADDVVEQFIDRAAANGVDVFRVFDALNDLRNLETALKRVKKNKKHAQGTICYTTSPVHSLAGFVQMGVRLAEMGCDSIAIKDMAGLLTPHASVALVEGLSRETTLPIHLHTHSTSGLAAMCHYQAVLAGCRHIDTVLSSFSGGASHPATESLVAALADTPYDTQLDLNQLLEINDHFQQVRKKYQQFESEAIATDPRVQVYQVPGGMISNLYNQLKEQQALDKIEAVHAEIPKVRKDLGYPPLVTPSSQLVGTQAVLNVLAGVRYQSITNEVKLYCQGKYGAAPGKVSARLRKKAIGNTPVIDVRPASLLGREYAQLRQDIGDLAQSEEDVLSYAMFPEIGRQFLQERREGTLQPEPLLASGSSAPDSRVTEFAIGLHGENYQVKIAGFSEPERGRRRCYLWLDGVPEEVLIEAEMTEGDEAVLSNRAKPPQKGDITVAMPGTLVSVNVREQDQVKKGQVLCVLEAMKMETEIQAPQDGVVRALYCQKGDKVTPAQILMHLADA